MPKALAHAALVDKHLSDGRDWLLGGDEPTFSDITMATAIAFSRRWMRCPTFLAAYADRNSGVAELDKASVPKIAA